MALRRAVLQASDGNTGFTLSFMRLAHVAAIRQPMDAAISSPIPSPPSVLPEFDQNPDNTNNNSISFGFSSLPFGGSMELMAVPKKKVSRHKKGIRNGPKALKPVPVIIRCKSCGRVKLPHFFCCSGDRMTEE